MKHTISLILITAAATSPIGASDCDILLAPRWDNLEKNSVNQNRFGGKWMLVGSITFRKTSKQSAKLGKISLQWHGDHIQNLSGSLFKKIPEKSFMPIDDNLLCDGSWNKKEQCLILDFHNKQQTLGPRSIFYLVFTIPEAIEGALKNGHFSLAQTNLPETLYKNNQDLKLDLAQLHRNQSPATRT